MVEETEADIFLGENPNNQQIKEIALRDDIADRIQAWTKNRLKKEETEIILDLIPKEGKISLEAPALNDEIAAGLHPNAQTKDDYYKKYQNQVGASLSATASVLSMILNDKSEPLDRKVLLTALSNAVKLQADLHHQLNQARKVFLVGRYEEKKDSKIFKES